MIYYFDTTTSRCTIWDSVAAQISEDNLSNIIRDDVVFIHFTDWCLKTENDVLSSFEKIAGACECEVVFYSGGVIEEMPVFNERTCSVEYIDESLKDFLNFVRIRVLSSGDYACDAKTFFAQKTKVLELAFKLLLRTYVLSHSEADLNGQFNFSGSLEDIRGLACTEKYWKPVLADHNQLASGLRPYVDREGLRFLAKTVFPLPSGDKYEKLLDLQKWENSFQADRKP